MATGRAVEGFALVVPRFRITMDAVLGELQCPVCLELFSHPIILPCSHILCRDPCATRISHEGFIRCPVCRDHSYVSGGIDNLPRVLSLENIIEQYQFGSRQNDDSMPLCTGAGDIPCHLCDGGTPRKAFKSCLDCNASYCKLCLQFSHPEKEPFFSHRLVEPRRYPRPSEPRCPVHDMRVNIYCLDCRALGCLLCADDPSAHPNHHVMSLRQASSMLRTELETHLGQASGLQNALTDGIQTRQELLADFQREVDENRAHMNRQCDNLISEVEDKRHFFLSDLNYEEKTKSDKLLKAIVTQREQNSTLQSLVHYVRDVLKETDVCAFIQLAKTVSDRFKQVSNSTSDPETMSIPSTTLQHKLVDLRKERALLRDITYLAVPATPEISMEKCSRSANSVVLVLTGPSNEYDVIDGYHVFYCSKSLPVLNEQEKITFKSPQEERNARGNSSSNAVCLIQDNLRMDTMYYFSVRAYNSAGESDMSAIVNCRTMSSFDQNIPVPSIVENQCRAYTHSIQIYSASPLDVSSEDCVSHYLLYREASDDKIWKSISMYGRLDHRVFGLESDMEYDFVVMACGKNGECQVSNTVNLRTERAAY